jgi:hypothetical protein
MTTPVITLRIGVEGANVILSALAARPYNEVADLIAFIRHQAGVQLQEQQAPVSVEQKAAPAPVKRKPRAKAPTVDGAPKRRGRPPGSRNKVVAIAAPAAEPVAEAA